MVQTMTLYFASYQIFLYFSDYEMCVLSCSVLSSSVTPWTAAHQAPLSMGFSRPEYWSGLPFPSPGDLPNPEIKLGSPALQADSLPAELPGNYETENFDTCLSGKKKIN